MEWLMDAAQKLDSQRQSEKACIWLTGVPEGADTEDEERAVFEEMITGAFSRKDRRFKPTVQSIIRQDK